MKPVGANVKRDLRPIVRETVTDQVYASLRDGIMRGELAPGQTVTIQGLAADLQVSAMPVREALHRLCATHALTVVSGRSVGVPKLNAGRLVDLQRVRREIEGMAASWAARDTSDTDIADLSHFIDEMWRADRETDRARYLAANQQFHFRVYEMSGSPTIMPIVESLWLQIGPYLNLLHNSGNFETSNHIHEAVRDGLAAGDSDAVRNAIISDIDGAARTLTPMLQSETASNQPVQSTR